MKRLFLILLGFYVFELNATVYHVSKSGIDNNPGTSELPFLTIQAAAKVAFPGDTIMVYQGVYREKVVPPRGGISHNKRIVYMAAPGEKVEIKGSEIIKGWEKVTGSVWKVILPNTFFGDYNPYKDFIKGDWFHDLGRVHHTGEVYLNGKSLWEVALISDVFNPKMKPAGFESEGSLLTWFCETDKDNTYLFANFQGTDPNTEIVEINVRNSCFYPSSTGVNYITVDGFRMSQAATQWAPPTAEQIGLIGTNWSKGWIIENNIISDSKCSGVTLGKHGDEFDNTSEDSAEGYVETIYRAIERGWSKENIGSHIVRNNIIFNCEQTGICGSMGAVFSLIENNYIYNIWTKRQFAGHEMGGIKIHAPIDMVIRNNVLVNCGRGLWLDWMTQGTRVTGNLMYKNTTDDMFIEVNHGPYLVDNNFMLSPLSLRDWSEGGAYVHNLFGGNIEVLPQDRFTPYHKPHSTELAALKQTECGDNRFYNNIFIGGNHESNRQKSGLASYNKVELPIYVGYNIYMNRAGLFRDEPTRLEIHGQPELKIWEEGMDIFISLNIDRKVSGMKTPKVNTAMLGHALVTGQGFTKPDGTPVEIENDYFGNLRRGKHPIPGPIDRIGYDKLKLTR